MASAISDDDKLQVLKFSMVFATGPTASNLTSTCKGMVENRYGPLKRETFKCAACEKTIDLKKLDTPCSYHPGASKVWVKNWEDPYDGAMFSGYSMHDCCRAEHISEPCKQASRHNNTGRRCLQCKKIIEGRSTKGPCQYHPSNGATHVTPTWDCCKSTSFGSPGCKTEDNHLFETEYEEILSCTWSKLGSKALIRTTARTYVMEYHKKSQTWTQYLSLRDYPETGGPSLSQEHKSSLNSSFSHDGTKIILRSNSTHYLYDIKSGVGKSLVKTYYNDYFTHSWGRDAKYLFFLSNSPDSDYGEIILNALDLQTNKTLRFANFTTSIPFDYDKPVKLDTAILVQAPFGTKRSFKHPDLNAFISRWIGRDSLRLMEPYGNRMLFVTTGKRAVHYSYKVTGGDIKIDVLGTTDSHIWRGIGNSLHGIQWLKNGFVALVQENLQGTAFYKRYKHQVWWFDDKLERIKTNKLPKEVRAKEGGWITLSNMMKLRRSSFWLCRVNSSFWIPI